MATGRKTTRMTGSKVRKGSGKKGEKEEFNM
jgi:hypothetical protein